MVARLEHSGNAPETQLEGPFAQGALSFTVLDGTGYPEGELGNFWVILDRGTSSEEAVLCATRSVNTFTVAASGRGGSGTSDTSHSAGASVEHGLTAQEIDDLNALAVQLNDVISEWTPYTTSLRSNGADASLGNGTIKARYKKVGRIVHFDWLLTAGTTTTWGTNGGIAGLLPLPPHGGSALDWPVPATNPVSLASSATLTAVKAAGGDWWDLYLQGVGQVSGTPGNGSRYHVSGTYEAVS